MKHFKISLEKISKRDLCIPHVRIIVPDSFCVLDHMVLRFTSIVRNLVVYPERMLENLGRSRGVVFSGTVLLELARRGVSREDAYLMVQRNAMKSHDEELDFKSLLLNDREVTAVIPSDEIDRVFDLDIELRHVDSIFARVFGKGENLVEAES